MSIKYYLYCKKRYSNIIKLLEEIINEYELIFCLTSELDIDLLIKGLDELNIIENRNNFIIKLNYVNKLKTICDENIKKMCKHDFEEDYIDITPERSEKIIYCKICEYTK
jgi:hypothetical protein